MTPPAIRKAQERQRLRDAGKVRLEFVVPADKAQAVRDAVAAIQCGETQARPGQSDPAPEAPAHPSCET
jgi:hypothetical protein